MPLQRASAGGAGGAGPSSTVRAWGAFHRADAGWGAGAWFLPCGARDLRVPRFQTQALIGNRIERVGCMHDRNTGGASRRGPWAGTI